jgi:flagellin
MRAQITGLNAASKNVKDGISLVKTAEGAMQEIQDMLNRMDYLATQSANGTYDNEVDRAALQKEVNQLNDEINRIADSANFNGIKLLDGTWDTDAVAKAEETVKAAQAKLDNPTFDTEYAEVSKSDMEDLLLDLPAAGAQPVVGTNTVLETTGVDGGKPGFSVELDGFSYGVATPGTDTITLTIGGQTLVSDAIGTAGDPSTVLDAKDIAALFDGKTFTSDLTDKAGTAMKFDVKADGSKLVFTPQTDPGQTINANMDVSIKGTATTTTKVDAVKDKYTTGALTSNGGTVTAGDKITFTVAYKNAAGEDLTKDVEYEVKTGDDASKVAAGLIDAINKDADLKGLFKASGSNTGIVMEALEGGANKGSVTSITVKTAGTFKAEIAADPTAANAQVDGADETFTGPKGSLNVGTVNIKVNAEGSSDRLANTIVDLSGHYTDGTKITLGDKTYTIALGKDSAYKDAENVVDLTDYEADTLDKEVAASRLTEVAAKSGNTVFSIGQDKTDKTKITLQQLSTAKDSTDMETMDGLLNYIKIEGVDATATEANKTAAVDAAKKELAAAQEKLDAANKKGGKALNLQIGDTSDDYNQLGVKIGSMRTEALGVDGLSIATAEDASKAIDTIKSAINHVSSVRGDLGAYQNRLEHTQNNLSVMAENIQDAESTIRDTDVAEEMMSYVKNNILVQSAQAMLAQANQVPQGVLQLLG